jgi:hypothetical protein
MKKVKLAFLILTTCAILFAINPLNAKQRRGI